MNKVNDKMAKKIKIILGAVLFFQIGVFSFALAADSMVADPVLNLTYPDIPGLGRLSDYRNLESGQKIGFIISYIFKLFFFVCVGAGLIALLISGILYIASFSKPRWLIRSKQMASNAMLGLFILLCSYLFLYAINPQLLSLTLQKPKLEIPVSTTADIYSPETIVIEEVPIATVLLSSVQDLKEKIYLDSNRRYYENIYVNGSRKDCLTDGYGTAVNTSGEPLKKLADGTIESNGCVVPASLKKDYVFRAEIPFKETAKILNEAVGIVEDKKDANGNTTNLGLEGLLARCQCGKSNGYAKWGLPQSKCLTGLNPDKDNNDKKIEEYKALGQFCSIQCQNCGSVKDKDGYFSCDLRDVRKSQDTGKVEICMRESGCIQNDDCWISWDGFSERISKCGENAKTSELIKLKVMRLQELQAKLESYSRFGNFPQSVTLLGRALDINKSEYLLGQAQEGYWSYDFSDKVAQWGDKYQVVVQPFKSSNESVQNSQDTLEASFGSGFNGLLARVKDFFNPVLVFAVNNATVINPSPATFYFIVHAPKIVQDENITNSNIAIKRESDRFSLFSVLTRLPLEGIEDIFKQCLSSAFGEAEYILNRDQVEQVITSSLKEGAGDYLEKIIVQKLDEIAQAAIDGTNKSIAKSTTEAVVSKFLAKCCEGSFNGQKCIGAGLCANKTPLDIINDMESRCSFNNPCCYCVQDMMEKGIPPHFVSDMVSGLLSKNLGDVFPEIRRILDTQTMEVLFPKDRKIGAFLNTETINIYDKMLNGALTKPFPEQIPALDKVLNQQMQDVLPDFVADQLKSIDTWLATTMGSSTMALKNLKKTANDFANRLAGEYVVQPVHEWAQSQFEKMGLGTPNWGITECYFNLERGYFYNVSDAEIAAYNNLGLLERASAQKPGRCQKMTALEINQKDTVYQNFEEINNEIPPKIRVVSSQVISKANKELICSNAGYSWECGTTITNEGGFLPGFNKNTDCECAEKDDLIKDTRSAVETLQNIDKVKTYAGAGLVNYAEKMTMAFTQTALKFAMAYAQVFVEDNLIAPFISSWNTISGFQQGLHSFLTSSVKNILPDQISAFLQSNLNSELADFCSYYEQGKEEFERNGRTSCDPSDYIPVKMVLNLPDQVTFDKSDQVRGDLCVSQEAGDKICKIEKHLHTTPFEELAFSCEAKNNSEEWKEMCRKIVDTLNLPLGEALEKNVCVNDKCLDVNNWFRRNLASMLWPNLEGIEKLVKGTPKQLLCGELAIAQDKGVLIAPSGKCAGLFKNKFGLIPYIDTESQNYEKNSPIIPQCFFINYVCKTPVSFPNSKTTLGALIKSSMEKACSFLDQAVKRAPEPGCSGDCFCQYNCPSGDLGANNFCQAKNYCKLCSSMAKNSVFYTLVFELVKSEPSFGDRNNEKEFYAQMVNDFPELEKDLMALASNRGFDNWQDILDLNPDVQNLLKTISSPKLNNLLKLGVLLGRTNINAGNTKLRSILSQDIILSQTPYGLLKNTVCPEVVRQFSSVYPQYTLESITADFLRNQANALPYSLEDLDTFSFGEKIRVLTNLTNLDEDLKDAYLFCSILDKTPKEISGLDQALKNYIRPKEYQVLFELLQNELSEGSPQDCKNQEVFTREGNRGYCCDTLTGFCYAVGEKPANLSALLDYMDTKDPVESLRDLQISMPVVAEGKGTVFPFVNYISVSNNCLKAGTVVNLQTCRSPLTTILANDGIALNSNVVASDRDVVVYGDGLEIVKAGNVWGKTSGIDQNNNSVDYYFIKPQTTQDIILIYKDPNRAKTNFGLTLDFMETQIGSILENAFGHQTILDYVCSQLKSGNASLCDLEINGSLANKDQIRQRIAVILGKTPVDLAALYLDNEIDISKLFAVRSGGEYASIMDALAANTVLGEPLLDTLGNALGWTDNLFNYTNWANEKSKWVDQGALSAVKAIQDGLETALVDWPKSAGRAIAGLIGLEIGEKTASEVSGACYSIIQTESCKEGEQLREKDGKRECCILAKSQACRPLCRFIDSKIKKCDVLSGELPNPEEIGNGQKICCFKQQDNKCVKCRSVDFASGGTCRKDENGQLKETEDIANGLCCYSEDFRESDDVANSKDTDAVLRERGFCCTTVSECISGKLAPFWANMAMDIASGKIQLQSLKEK